MSTSATAPPKPIWLALAFGLCTVECGAKTEPLPLPYCDDCERPREQLICVCPERTFFSAPEREPSCAAIGDSCTGTFAPVSGDAPNLLILLDKSSSASERVGGVEIWTLIRQALDQVIDPYKHSLNLGLELFPSLLAEPLPAQAGQSLPSCYVSPRIDIPIGDGVTKALEISTRLETVPPAGGTPMADVLQNAHDYFTTGSGAELTGPKYVLLVTDGGPNCNPFISCDADQCTASGNCGDQCCVDYPEGCLDDARAIDRISQLREIDVQTVVMGIGRSDVYETVLNQLAIAGGRELEGAVNYYRVDPDGDLELFAETIAQVFGTITDPCNFDVPGAVPGEVNLVEDCTVIPGGGNWTYGGDPPRINITGDLCDRVRNGETSLDVLLGCPTVL